MISLKNITLLEKPGSRIIETLLLAILGVVLTACSALIQAVPDGSQPEERSPEVVVVSHPGISSVDVIQSKSDPGEAVVSIIGSLPNGCNELDEWSLTQEGKDFFVTLPVKSQPVADCTQSPVPYEVTIPLNFSGLESGSYSIIVNGINYPFDLSFENLPSTRREQPCQISSTDEVSYTNDTHGYCLLYPAGFTVRTPESHVIVIQGPNYSAGPEPLNGFVNIQALEPARGRSAAQVSDELVSEFQGMENITIERVDSLLGGEPAVEIIGMPGRALSWQVVTVHDDQVYLLVFSPLGEEYEQAFTDMQTLYDIVMRSFAFTDAPNPPETETLEDNHVSFEIATFRDEATGFEFDYPVSWILDPQQVGGDRGTYTQLTSWAHPPGEIGEETPPEQTRLDVNWFQWDPKGDLDAYLEVRKQAWSASGFNILSEEEWKLAGDLRAARYLIQAPEEMVFFLIATVGDQYVVLSGTGDLDLLEEIAQTARLSIHS